MKLFVTGGTGFVGSHFINAAHRAGHVIIALRRPGAQPRVPLEREPMWVDGQLDGDHRAALQGSEVVVHFASHTPNPPYDTLCNCLYWNVQSSIQLAEQARKLGVTRFLVAGSCFEYGRSAERYAFIPVTAPLEPTLSYPTSKAAASIAFHGFALEHQLQLKIYRIFHVYGEGEQANRLWPSLRSAALAGADFPMTPGEQLRDFVDVKQVALSFVQGLDFSDTSPGQPILRHVASGKQQTLLEFARYWWRLWDAKGELQPGLVQYRNNEMMRLVPEVSSDR